MEWARIPHFYTAFYVYQYSTILGAIALSRRILQEGKPAVDDYPLPSGGSSNYPMNFSRAEMTT